MARMKESLASSILERDQHAEEDNESASSFDNGIGFALLCLRGFMLSESEKLRAGVKGR